MEWSEDDWDRFFDALGGKNISTFKEWLKGNHSLDVFDPEYALSPLHHAARKGNTKMIGLLLEKGANINLPRHMDLTPLMDAAQFNKPEAIRVLLDSGADETLKNDNGQTAEQLAEEAEAKQAFADFKKEKDAAIQSAMVKHGVPEDVERKIKGMAGLGRKKSRLNKKTRRTKRKRGNTKRR